MIYLDTTDPRAAQVSDPLEGDFAFQHGRDDGQPSLRIFENGSWRIPSLEQRDIYNRQRDGAYADVGANSAGSFYGENILTGGFKRAEGEIL